LFAQETGSASAARAQRLREIVLADDAIERLADVVIGTGVPGPVLIVQDETPITRAGALIKPLVASVFTAADCATRVIQLHHDDELHTTPDQIALVREALIENLTVIALGSGTIADIAKHAVMGFESEHPMSPLRLVIVQTANSVCAFTSSLAVVTTDGVKRTLPSRLADMLVIDTRLLADAPLAYTRGGIGDASVAAVSFADYRLSYLLGFTAWEPLSFELMEFPRSRFLGGFPTLGHRDAAGMSALALDLAATGLSMTVAGESAPVSGLEHVTSHTLDMAAAYHGRPVGNHGSQCALASILSLIAWQKLLTEVDLSQLDPATIDPAAEQAKVEAAFGRIDDDGRAWRECWADYTAKILAWQARRDDILAFVDQWPAHRADLQRFTTQPEVYVAALAASGHPLRFEDIPTGLDESQARWAFTNARLMRQRTSVADLLGFAGYWTEEFISAVFDTYHDLIPVKQRSFQ
jgi:glycerol-1-phosphate dehydrogenase [NAD(P)+]